MVRTGPHGTVGAIRDNGTVSLYRDEGVVLRNQKLGEADRIVTLLTRRTGLVRAVGKGVRRTKSRFGARLEPCTHVDLQLHTGRTLDVITQAETVRSYGAAVVSDYARYTAATAMLETAEKIVAVEKDPALRQFLLLIGALRTLGEGSHDSRLVLDAYLLRSLSVAGYAPALTECARCGSRGSTVRSRSTPAVWSARCAVPTVPRTPHRTRSDSCRRCSGATGTARTPATASTAPSAAGWSRPTYSGTWKTESDHCAMWSVLESVQLRQR